MGPNVTLGYQLLRRMPDGTVVTIFFGEAGIRINDMEEPISWEAVEEYKSICRKLEKRSGM